MSRPAQARRSGRRARRGSILAAVLGAALAASAASCGGSDVIDPSRVELTDDLPTQRELAALVEVWESGDEAKRRALEPALLAYVEARRDDPTSRRVAVMAAMLLVERGELERARRLVLLPQLMSPGPTRDMALVVIGASERREGRPDAALATLEPLHLRVIDAPTKTLLNEELVRAAVEARRFERAALYLRGWLRDAPRSAQRAIAIEAEALLARFPPEPLLAELLAERALPEPDPRTSELLASHLAGVVVEGEDAALARRLLDAAGSLLGDRTDAVERIAARGAVIRLDRSTVGLVVPRRSPHLGRRALDVGSGLGFALGHPGGRARLLTRDDAGSLEGVGDALVLLQSEGAAVIVAGYDREEADLVAAHAERTGVPVLLLAAPSKAPRADGPVFVLGEDAAALRGRLVDALVERGGAPIALLADERDAESLPPSTELAAVQPCGVPLEFVRASGARGLVVDGDDACARDLRERGALDVVVAFGLDARDAGPGLHARAAWIGPARTEGPSPLDTWRATGRAAPGWWTALGHDAGALARVVVEAIPEQAERDASARPALGAQVARELGRSEATLWTTDARGFRGARVLTRTVEIEDRTSARRSPARRR